MRDKWSRLSEYQYVKTRRSVIPIWLKILKSEGYLVHEPTITNTIIS